MKHRQFTCMIAIFLTLFCLCSSPGISEAQFGGFFWRGAGGFFGRSLLKGGMRGGARSFGRGTLPSRVQLYKKWRGRTGFTGKPTGNQFRRFQAAHRPGGRGMTVYARKSDYTRWNSSLQSKFVRQGTRSKTPSWVASGRAGRQARLRQLAHDTRVSRADRGWIRQEMHQIRRGTRRSIRVPRGKHLAHRRGFEARHGHSYQHSDLQGIRDHRLQHRFEGYR